MRFTKWHYITASILGLLIIGTVTFFLYMKHLNDVGATEYRKAEEAFAQSDFNQVILHLDKVPSKSKTHRQVPELKEHAKINLQAINTFKRAKKYYDSENYEQARLEINKVSVESKNYPQASDLKKKIEIELTVKTEFKLASDAFSVGDFGAMNAHIKKIASESKLNPEVAKLIQKDPTKLKVEGLLPPAFKVEDKKYVMLTRTTPAFVVSGKETGQNPLAHVYVYFFDNKSLSYVLGYMSTNQYYGTSDHYEIEFGNVFSTKEKNGILLSFFNYGASGWGTDFEVLGLNEESNKIVSYMTTSAYEGEAKIVGGNIQISNNANNISEKFIWNGNAFENQKVSIQKPASSSDIRFQYSVSDSEDNTVNVSTKTITLVVGQKAVVERMDSNEKTVRFMTSGDTPSFEMDAEGNIIGKKVGTNEFQIVPNYSDWDKAVTITVKVIK